MHRPNAVRVGVRWQTLVQTLAAILLVCAMCTGQDEATLYFINRSPSGKACTPSKNTLLESGKKIAQLDYKRYAVVSIAQGHHVLQLQHVRLAVGAAPKVELDVVPAETYYLVVSNNWVPPVACYWTLKKATKDEAEKLIAKLKLQQGKTD